MSYAEHIIYVCKVREQLRRIDEDAPEDFGTDQQTRLTGDAYYVAKFDTCWLAIEVIFSDKSPMIPAWAAIIPEENGGWHNYYGLVISEPGAGFTELNEGWYEPKRRETPIVKHTGPCFLNKPCDKCKESS